MVKHITTLYERGERIKKQIFQDPSFKDQVFSVEIKSVNLGVSNSRQKILYLKMNQYLSPFYT